MTGGVGRKVVQEESDFPTWSYLPPLPHPCHSFNDV